MRTLCKIQIFALILLQPLICGSQDFQYVNGTLPKAECINEVLDREIRYYLAQQDKATAECWWNLRIVEKHDMYGCPGLYQCHLSRQPHYVPDEGIAYLQYGNDIIVIEESLNKDIFMKVEGWDRNVRMLRKRVPMNTPVAYLGLLFSKNKIFKIQAEYDCCR